MAQYKDWWENKKKSEEKEKEELSALGAKLQPVEPWPQPVDGAQLLDDIAKVIERFVVVPAEAIVAESLWILFAHTLDCFTISPMLTFTSPTRECGKSINQSIIGMLTPKALPSSNITPAVLFRVIEKYQPDTTAFAINHHTHSNH